MIISSVFLNKSSILCVIFDFSKAGHIVSLKMLLAFFNHCTQSHVSVQAIQYFNAVSALVIGVFDNHAFALNSISASFTFGFIAVL
jgi:hypothetical protein